MKIELFFKSLRHYFETVRFLKSNKLWFQETDKETIIVDYDTNILTRTNYKFGIVK